MPLRTQQHELDQEACTEFQRRIPRGWVFREIKPDYGVDFQVEIFENGHATGLFFHVQVKGTDDIGRDGKVRIEIDRLQYLKALAVPALIVQWCAASSSFYWIWLWDALLQVRRPENDSVTIVFDDQHRLATEKFPPTIVETIKKLRALSNDNRHAKIGILISQDCPPPEILCSHFDLYLALTHKSELFATGDSPDNQVAIKLECNSESITVSVNGFDPVRISLWCSQPGSRWDAELGFAKAVMALISLLRTRGLEKHAAVLSEYAADRHLISDNHAHCLDAVLSLMHAPVIAVSRAIELDLVADPSFGLRMFLAEALRCWRKTEDLPFLTPLLEHAAKNVNLNPNIRKCIDFFHADILFQNGCFRKSIAKISLWRKELIPHADDADVAYTYLKSLIHMKKYKIAYRISERLYANSGDIYYRYFMADILCLSGQYAASKALFKEIYTKFDAKIKLEIELRFAMFRELERHSRNIPGPILDWSVKDLDDRLSELMQSGENVDICSELFKLTYRSTSISDWEHFMTESYNNKDFLMFLCGLFASALRCGFRPFANFAMKNITEHLDEFHINFLYKNLVDGCQACKERPLFEKYLIKPEMSEASMTKLISAYSSRTKETSL